MMVLLLMMVMERVSAQPTFAVLPPVPPSVEANAKHAKIGEFVELWKKALEIEGIQNFPARRLNFGEWNLILNGLFLHCKSVPCIDKEKELYHLPEICTIDKRQNY